MPTIDLVTDDLRRASSDELYLGIESFAKSYPSEGWKHDFTVEWSDSGLQKIAAFANTFGGLLLVGVKKDKTDTLCQFVGVDSPTEYKTRIASSIATNMSPVPLYEIFECREPGNSSRGFCIVRVRMGKVLHLVTRKGMAPVWVRTRMKPGLPTPPICGAK